MGRRRVDVQPRSNNWLGEGFCKPAGIIEFIYFESYRQPVCRELARFVVQAFNHDVGRLDESGGCIASSQAQFPDRCRSDDRGNLSVSNCQDHLRKKPLDSDADHFAGKLIPSTHAPVPVTRLSVGLESILVEEWFEASERYAMVSSRGLDRLQSPGQYPVLDRGITYPQNAGSLSGCQHLFLVRHAIPFSIFLSEIHSKEGKASPDQEIRLILLALEWPMICRFQSFCRVFLTSICAVVLTLGSTDASPQEMDHSQPTVPSTQLTIRALDAKPMRFTPQDIAAMPHKSVSVYNHHTKATEIYSGVPLADLLGKAGVPLGEHVRGKRFLIDVVAEGTDHYGVLYALAEIDPSIHTGEVIVADSIDGQKLGKDGAFKMVSTEEKRPARWVRNLSSVTLIEVNP